MCRSVLSLCVGLGLISICAAAPAPNARSAPSTAKIKQAIEDLGSKRFEVRSSAQKLLFEAGEAAEPFLKEALKSQDAEVTNAAKTILDKFEWGLYADTPKEVQDRIEAFRAGGPAERLTAVTGLFQQKPVLFRTVRKLLIQERDAELRQQMFAGLQRAAQAAMPELLTSSRLESAEEMLEFTLTGAPPGAAANYAALIHLRGKADPTIARLEKERQAKGEGGPLAAEVLMYLYRGKGDFANAEKAARDTGKDDLIDRVLWQAGDWKALARMPTKSEGVEAAYARLAGDKKLFDEKIAEIKKLADDPMDNSPIVRKHAEALLFNGCTSEALKLLVDKTRETDLVFSLLCAQMKFKEAHDYVDEARRLQPDAPENASAQMRRARMLYFLGERDAGIQLLNKVAADLKKNTGLATALLRTDMALGLRDLALEHAARALAPFDRLQLGLDGPELLKPIFGDDALTAQTWLSAFKNEEAAAVMQRVAALFAGKVDRKKLDEWAAKLLEDLKNEADQVPHFENVDAVAAAYRAVGDAAKAEEHLKFAAEKMPTSRRYFAYGDFLMKEKRHKEAAQAYAEAAKSPPPAPPRTPPGVGRMYFGAQPDEFSPALATYLRGRALLLAGDEMEGQRLVELATWLPLGDDNLRAKLVEQLRKRGWPEMADREAEMALKTGWHIDVVYGNMLANLAERAIRKKDYVKGADYYEKCMVGIMRTGATLVEPSAYLLLPETIRNCRALASVAAGKIDEALKEANAGLETVPGNLRLASYMVPDLDKLGKKNEANAIYRKVHDIWEKVCTDYPGSGHAHNTIAFFMAGCGRDLDAALKHAIKATELEPKNAAYIDTLAEVRFRKGERDAALALMKKCLEIDPKRIYFQKQLVRFKDQPFDSATPDETE